MWEDVRLEILVSDDVDHSPLDDALLQVTARLADFQVEAFTDSAGTAAWRLVPDEYRVRVEKAGYLPGVLDVGLVTGVPDVRREIRLTKAGLVHGWVGNQSGKPVEAAQIEVVDRDHPDAEPAHHLEVLGPEDLTAEGIRRLDAEGLLEQEADP